MTIAFVMLGEVLIFLPSIANFRVQWLKGRIAQAEIAALAAEAAPDRILSSDLRSEILKGAGVLVVSLTRGEMRQLMLRSDTDIMIDDSYDLREVQWLPAVVDAFAVMIRTEERVIGVIDRPPNMSGDLIEVALYEAPLRQAMIGYGVNILILSVILSMIVAGLVFAALNVVLVRPIKRLTNNMVAFAENPEDRSRIIAPIVSSRNSPATTPPQIGSRSPSASTGKLPAGFRRRNSGRLAQGRSSTSSACWPYSPRISRT